MIVRFYKINGKQLLDDRGFWLGVHWMVDDDTDNIYHHMEQDEMNMQDVLDNGIQIWEVM
jgi:hypothetical protein